MANFLTRFGTLRQWHWISSALCLAGMLLFAVTGITLNHAGQIEARPSVHTLEEQMPEALRAQLNTPADALPDRKSTRLNSSHVRISYAVFCLKKKKHH